MYFKRGDWAVDKWTKKCFRVRVVEVRERKCTGMFGVETVSIDITVHTDRAVEDGKVVKRLEHHDIYDLELCLVPTHTPTAQYNSGNFYHENVRLLHQPVLGEKNA